MASVEEISNAVSDAVDEINANYDNMEEELNMDLEESLRGGYVFYR